MRVETCPQCGAPSESSVQRCIYCRAEFVIASASQLSCLDRPAVEKYIQFYRKTADGDSTGEAVFALGLCHLKLRLYSKASESFDQLITAHPEMSDAHYYLAICLFAGQKPFLASRQTIDMALELVNAAIAINPRGVYYYLLALIKHDYFARKFLRTSPDHRQAMAAASSAGVSKEEASAMYEAMNMACPSELVLVFNGSN